MRAWWAVLVLMACDDAGTEPGQQGADGAGGAVDGAVVGDLLPVPDGAGGADAQVPGRDRGLVDAAPPVDGAAADAGRPADAGPGDAARPPPDQGIDAAGPPADCLAAVVAEAGFEIFAHEASRADATADQAGQAGGGACTRPGVLPWVGLTRPEAEAACAASGFRLCTDAEWQGACQGDRRWGFPYAAEHRPGTCNDHVSGTGRLQPTGALPDCRTPEGVFDLSGNVWEMTADGSRRGASWRVNAVMFRTEAARCDIPYVNSDLFFADDLGFRCCRTVP